jgi:TonB-linked SusC/RagA family outer membrane protein
MGQSLIFSYVGFSTQEIKVERFGTLQVMLAEDTQSLDEVVVIGYGTQKRALITGASVNVTGDEIASLNTSTPMQALQGTTPGVNITNINGEPGAGTKVTIRGIGTTGNSNPLYIVDGVAVGSIDYLSASDIASIDVLKDAASAAIYGSRAANGVVLVTTVKGKKGSGTRVSFDSYYGIQNIYKNLDPLTAQEYMYIMDEGRVNDGLEPNDWHSILVNNAWLNANFPGDLGTQLGDEIWAMLEDGWEGTNFIDEMSNENAPVSNYALNITGSTEGSQYSFGVSYYDQEGILGGDLIDAGYERLTLRMNTDFVLFKNDEHAIITLGENLTYTNTENRSVATGNIYWNDLHNALVQNPLMPAYWQQAITSNVDANGFTPTLDGLSNDQTNPLAVMFYRSNYSNLGNKNNTVVGNVYLEIQPIKDLIIRSSFGIDSWFGQGRSWTPTYGLGVLYGNTIDAAQQTMYFGNNWTWTTTAAYDFTVGGSKFNVLLGNEVYKNQVNTNVGGWMANTRFGSAEYAYLNNVDKSDVNSIGTWGADYAAGGGGILSYIGRAQYDYKEKYLLSATVRADGSSNFAEGNRWGVFPSVSAGWVMTEEDFLKDTSNWLDFAKLRASWGQNGNQSIDNFIYSANIAYFNPGYYFGDTKPISGATAAPAVITNPDVSWETSEQLDFGLDARFLNSRLALTMDWYNKKTKDWLVIPSVPGTSGAGPAWINGGDVQNTGFEFSLGWNDEYNDWKYGATISGAWNNNEVTRIANSDGIIQGPSSVISQGTAAVSRAQVGYPIGYFYGLTTDGILQNQSEVDAYVVPETDIYGNPNANAGQPYFSDQRPGDMRFVDQNQDGVIDEEDKGMIGNPNPDFQLGIQLNIAWKGFYANTTLAGKYGMQVMTSYRSFADRFDQNYTSEIFNRWHGEGTSTDSPRLTSTSNRNTNYISDIYVHDADFLRINNLTFGYNFAEILKDYKAISNIQLYVAVNNLHTFTNYTGMDPDVRYGGTVDDAPLEWGSGIDLGLYPLPRTVMFGFNIDF